MREKSEHGKYKVLHNLSYPYNQIFVNLSIPKRCTEVHYSDLREAIDLIIVCAPIVFIAKADITDAFRLVPLKPSHCYLTCFTWKNYYYYDRNLSVGCAASCKNI